MSTRTYLALFGTILTLFGGGSAQAQGRPDGVFVGVRPVRGPGVNTPSLDGPAAISGDGLTLYINSLRPWLGDYEERRFDNYVATRSSTDEPFGNAQELFELNTPSGDAVEYITRDGLTLYFAANRDDPGTQGSWDIWFVTREDVREDFRKERIQNLREAGSPIEINTASAESAPTLSCDGRTLIFQRFHDVGARPGLGQFELLMATRDDPDDRFGFGQPVYLDPPENKLNTPHADGLPYLSCDGLTLFFSCWAYGVPSRQFTCRPEGKGEDDLWIAWRDGAESSFTNEPQNLDLGGFGWRLCSPFVDVGPVISFDWPAQDSTLYFASGRPHPLSRGGNGDAFEATWLDSSNVVRESESPRTSGALNCGGWKVEGTSFERDRFLEDEVAWTGNRENGYVVTRTSLGHLFENPDGSPRVVWGHENPRPVDTARIAGGDAATAGLLRTSTWSPERLEYHALVVPGRYDVTLYFAESFPEAVNGLGQGARICDVFLNGEKVLCNWSAASAAGSAAGSGNPQMACGALLDTAIARQFSLSVADDDPDDGEDAGALDIVVAPVAAIDPPLPALLSAFSFERTGDATGDPASGDIECVTLDPALDIDVEEAALERAAKRWDGSRGALFINCGGPLLACSATEHPAKGATGDPDAGSTVVWLPDLANEIQEPFEGEFFAVRPAGRAFALEVVTTDMGFWDARGTEAGWDQNDQIFHDQRSGGVEYEIFADDGDYEVTLYFVNALAETAGSGQRFFHIDVEGAPVEGFKPCPVLGTTDEGDPIPNPVWEQGIEDLFDPVDEAEAIYSPDDCSFEPCLDARVSKWFSNDPDQDGIPAYLECGNVAAVALRLEKVPVDDGALTIVLTGPWGEDEPFSLGEPIVAGMSVERVDGPTLFRRGDVNADGQLNITDGVFVFNFLFTGGAPPPCRDAADTSDQGSVNISSGIYILNFLFLGGPPPPAPFEECGHDGDLEDPDLGCDSFPPCEP